MPMPDSWPSSSAAPHCAAAAPLDPGPLDSIGDSGGVGECDSTEPPAESTELRQSSVEAARRAAVLAEVRGGPRTQPLPEDDDEDLGVRQEASLTPKIASFIWHN